MVGEIVFHRGGTGRLEEEQLHGLRVLRCSLDPAGWFYRRRLRRAAEALRRFGVGQVLAPEEFDGWAELKQRTLRPVSAAPLLRSCAAPLALAALERQGARPERGAVALLGSRADRDMARAAWELCSQVRGLSVSAPAGGEELARWLRREYGLPQLPVNRADAALRFDADCPRGRGEPLELWGDGTQLGGVTLTAPELGRETPLPVLSALWQGGKLPREALEIT